MRKLLPFGIAFFSCLLNFSLAAQKKSKPPVAIEATSAQARIQSALKNTEMRNNSPLRMLPAENLGPTVMSGRVVDLAVDPKNSAHFFVAYATGGLWETTNNGASFDPIFDYQMVITIGAIAVDWKTQKIWVGTGESNSSRSSYSGLGVFLGERLGNHYSWQHKGLADSHHIGRIVIDPTNSNRVFVAAMGHLYTPNKERGIFVTQDGGQNWNQNLFVDMHTGCIDIEINQDNPNEMFAATWTRKRRAWNFEEAGQGSGMYQSKDGGQNWQLMPDRGLPQKEHTGRIGIAYSQNILYAFIDNQTPKEVSATPANGLNKEAFLTMTKQDFLALQDDSLQAFLDENYLGANTTVQGIKSSVEKGDFLPRAIYDYLFEPTAAFYEKDIIGAEVYRFNSTSWSKTHSDPLDDVVYSYGYYFGMIEANPKNSEELYIAGVPLITSKDGGKTWRGINPVNVHADHHALWINPNSSGHLINGSDGGLQISYDDGKTWTNCNSPSVAQCYAVAVEQTPEYNIYCGLQDNGVWVGPSNYNYSREWLQTGHYPYRQIMGGDGMQIAIDPRDNNKIITGYQFGQYALVNQLGETQHYIHPMHKLGESPYRWNWQTPILISTHQPDIMYICSNRVHRSTDGGKSFTTLSPDLTRAKMYGDVSFGTITCISESPSRMGHLVVGSDDGLVHVSKDNGYNWTNITGSLSNWLNKEGTGLWVSRVIFSRHQVNRIYVSLNGYRDDYFTPLAFYSDDLGKTWISFTQDLPQAEAVNVIKEDPDMPGLLYIGTDHGLYAVDIANKRTFSLSGHLPGAAIHDLAIHESSSTLIVGTHGRGMYKINLQLVRNAWNVTGDVVIGPIPSIQHGGRGNYWSKWFDNSHSTLAVPLFFKLPTDRVQFNICSSDSLLITSLQTQSFDEGLQFLSDYDLRIEKEDLETWKTRMAEPNNYSLPTKPAKDGHYYLPEGNYLLRVELFGTIKYAPFEVLE